MLSYNLKKHSDEAGGTVSHRDFEHSIAPYSDTFPLHKRDTFIVLTSELAKES